MLEIRSRKDIEEYCKEKGIFLDEFNEPVKIADDVEEMLNFQSKGDIATFILDTRYNADEKELYRRILTYEVRTY